MKSHQFLLPFFFLIISSSNSYTQNGAQLKRGIERAMAHEFDMDTAKITGFVIGLFDHDSTWIFPYGRFSKAGNVAIDSQTRFELGAASHPFLLSYVKQLAAEKRLDLDKNVNFYLETKQKFPLGDKITVSQLATHTSGLPKYPPDFGDFEANQEQPFANFTEGVLWQDLKNIDSSQITTGKYIYSHWGMALLEKLMPSFSKDYPHLFSDGNLAQGYNLSQKPVSAWQFEETFKAVLGVKISVVDALHFMTKECLKPKIDEILVPTELNKYTFMGNTWHVIQHNKYLNICVATGMTGGHSAFLGFIPQTQTGVVILTNSRTMQSKLGFQILRMLNNNWKRRH